MGTTYNSGTDGANTRALYHFNERGWNADSGPVVSNSQFKYGEYSLYFPGTGDIRSQSIDTIRGLSTSEWTIEAFIYMLTVPNGATARRCIISCPIMGGVTDHYWAMEMYWDGSTHYLSFRSSATGELKRDTGVLSANTWYHVAVSRDGNELGFFLDGTQLGAKSDVTGVSWPSSHPAIGVYVGVWLDGGTTAMYRFHGYIDELRFSNTGRYSTSFTAPEEAFTPDANTIILLDGEKVGNIDLESNLTSIRDMGTLGVGCFKVHSEYGGLPLYNAGYSITTSPAQKKFGGKSLYNPVTSTGFFRNTDVVATEEHLWYVPAGEFSIDLWTRVIYKPTDGAYLYIFRHYVDVSNGIHFRFYRSGAVYSLQYIVTIGGSNVLVCSADISATLAENTWHHCAVTRDSSNVCRIYFDGVKGDEDIWDGTFTTAGTTYIMSYDTTPNYPLEGYIDELRVSSVARWTGDSFEVPTEEYQGVPAEVPHDQHPYQPWPLRGPVLAR